MPIYMIVHHDLTIACLQSGLRSQKLHDLTYGLEIEGVQIQVLDVLHALRALVQIKRVRYYSTCQYVPAHNIVRLGHVSTRNCPRRKTLTLLCRR